MIFDDFAQIGLLHQHSSEDALELQFALRIEAIGRQLQQSQILFRRENCFGLFVEPRRGDAFNEKLRYFFRGCRIDRAIECQDAAECRNWIGREGFQVRVEKSFALGRSTGSVVLDDDRSGLFEFRREASRRFQVHIIVVRKLFALKLFRRSESCRCGPRRYIEGRGLVRIFAVAQRIASSATRCAFVPADAGFAPNSKWLAAAESRSSSVVIIPS